MWLMVIMEIRDYRRPLLLLKVFCDSVKIWVNPLDGLELEQHLSHVLETAPENYCYLELGIEIFSHRGQDAR